MAPHSSTLAWKIPWMGEPGRLQSMGSPGVRHDWATSLSCLGEKNGNPLQCSCLENPRDRGAWWASVYGVTQSRTQLKRLSSSSSSSSTVSPVPFIEDAVFALLYILASFVKNKVPIGSWDYFWAFCLVPLVYISVFVPVPYCLDDCSFVV